MTEATLFTTSAIQPMSRKTKLTIACVFFVAALIHSTIWSSITPLWQIPDEAAHYEYVRLMVKLGRMPHKGDEDPVIQADLLRSMWQNHYWEYLGFKRPEQPPTRILAGGWTSGGDMPDTAVVGDAYVYAFSNLTNPQPFYYLMLAPIQKAVIDQPIDDQLRALRAGSRMILALAVFFITLTAAELFKNNIALMIGAGVITLLQPMFVYIGSGMNNDVGVTLMIAVLAWQLTLAWRYGFAWWRIALIVLTAVIAIYTKRTAIYAAVWVPLVFGARWLCRFEKKRVARIALAVAGLSAGIGVLALMSYFITGKSPANWNNSDPSCQAWTSAVSRTGSRAFMLQGSCAVSHSLSTGVRRPIGVADGSHAIVNAWVKADKPGKGIIRLQDDSGNAAESVFNASTDWQPVSTTLVIASNASRLDFRVTDLSTSALYIDDLSALIQATQTFTLAFPNPSAENVTPVLGEALLSIGRMLGIYGQVSSMIQNYRANLAALPERLKTALVFTSASYWGKYGTFARAPNPGVSDNLADALSFLAGLAIISAIVQVTFRRRYPYGRLLIGLFILGLVIMFAQTFAPLLSFAAEGFWLPQGRYLFGGMALIAILLAYGWMGWLPAKWQWVGVIGIGVVLGAITYLGLQSVAGYFSLPTFGS